MCLTKLPDALPPVHSRRACRFFCSWPERSCSSITWYMLETSSNLVRIVRLALASHCLLTSAAFEWNRCSCSRSNCKLTSSGGRLLLVATGAGWRNVEVGALPALRGVKCCCSVLNAGLAGAFSGSSLVCFLGFGGGAIVLTFGAAGSSNFVAGLARRPILDTSGLVLTLADRLRPARRVDVLAIAGSGCAKPLLADATTLEGMCTDFGLSAILLGLVVLLLASGTVLED